jgi:hypothetical protein
MRISLKLPRWLFRAIVPKETLDRLKNRSGLTGKASISKGVKGASITVEYVDQEFDGQVGQNHGE